MITPKPSDPGSHDPTREEVRDGFAILFRTCLQATAGSVPLLLFDESFAELRDSFNDAVSNLPFVPTEIFVPRSTQFGLIGQGIAQNPSGNPALPDPIRHALSVSDVVLNALDSHRDTGPLRRAVLYGPKPNDCRFAHAPGLTQRMLQLLTTSPIQEIEEQSELVAWALGQAHIATLLTYDGATEHKLRLDLEGWNNPPLMSPGTIVQGSWGNILPGETFCCPEPASVNGSVFVDGSVPGTGIRPGEGVTLHFRDGRLVDWTGNNKSPPYRFFDDEKQKSIDRADRDWNVFAELGVGLNGTITELTGNSLYDEKAAHTIHVAIGENVAFGHANSAKIHADLVCRKPTLVIDGQTLIASGELQVADIQQKRRHVLDSAPKVPLSTTISLRQDTVRFADRPQIRSVKGERVTLIDMVPARHEKAVKAVMAELKNFGSVSVERFLTKHPTFDGVPAEKVIGLLQHYHVLEVYPQGGGAKS